jgi:hypothetical protein
MNLNTISLPTEARPTSMAFALEKKGRDEFYN